MGYYIQAEYAGDIVRMLSIGMVISAFFTFMVCLVQKAPYGRHAEKGWGPPIPARIAWVVMESPTLWITTFVVWDAYITGEIWQLHACNIFLLGFFYVHYIHRTLIYPIFRTANNSTPLPLQIPITAFCFCCYNAIMQSLAFVYVCKYNDEWLFGKPIFRFGVIIAVFGMVCNIHADSILVNLRAVDHAVGSEQKDDSKNIIKSKVEPVYFHASEGDRGKIFEQTSVRTLRGRSGSPSKNMLIQDEHEDGTPSEADFEKIINIDKDHLSRSRSPKNISSSNIKNTNIDKKRGRSRTPARQRKKSINGSSGADDDEVGRSYTKNYYDPQKINVHVGEQHLDVTTQKIEDVNKTTSKRTSIISSGDNTTSKRTSISSGDNLIFREKNRINKNIKNMADGKRKSGQHLQHHVEEDDLNKNVKRVYKIPHGGLFELVSAANLTGEIIQWLGFAIAASSINAWAFALFTFANIGPRGYHHHNWYRERFGDKYPRNRKAVIPFLW